MFIDIHSHCYRRKPPVYSFCTPDELIRRYDKMKVDMAVLLPVVSPEIYMPQSNEDILEICENHPDRFIPYCNIDPRIMTNSVFARIDGVLEHYKNQGCKGVGEIMPKMDLDDIMVQNLFRAAENVGLPVVYDGSVQRNGDFGLYDDPGLPKLEYMLLAFPKLKIFGHGPVFWHEIGKLSTVGARGAFMKPWGGQVFKFDEGPIEEEGTVPKLFRKYENLMGDLSDGTCFRAINRDHSYGPRFLSEFEDRLFFGTDMMSENMPVKLDSLLISWKEQGKISETTFNKIAYKNAEKLLGL